MSYKPADYNAVLDNAKKKSKEELEIAYADYKSDQDKSCGDIIGLIAVTILMVGFLFVIGYCIGEDNLKEEISDNLEEITEDICPLIENHYESQTLFKETRLLNKIICD